jgi:hypothetical protein
LTQKCPLLWSLRTHKMPTISLLRKPRKWEDIQDNHFFYCWQATHNCCWKGVLVTSLIPCFSCFMVCNENSKIIIWKRNLIFGFNRNLWMTHPMPRVREIYNNFQIIVIWDIDFVKICKLSKILNKNDRNFNTNLLCRENLAHAWRIWDTY